MADKDGVADGENVAVESEKADDIESWTSRQIEYLQRRRAAFKGVITKNSKKAKDIIARNGSRTVIRCVKERVSQALQNAYQTTQDIIALHGDNVNRRVEAEEWLDQLRSEFEDIVDTIEEFLERRADEPPSVFGELTVDRLSDEDDKASQPSHVSDGSRASSAAEKLAKAEIAALKTKQEKERLKEELKLQETAAKLKIQQEKNEAERLKMDTELLSKCAGSKVKKSEETESEEDEEFDSKDVDRMFKGIKKPTLTVFSGDKDLYHDWKAQFEIFVDQMKVPAKTKMMMLKNSLSGRPLRVVERLGYTPRQYQTALEKLDQKYGGEKRLMQRHLEAILRASPVEEANLKELEIFSDRLTDVVAKLEDNDQHQELTGVSALYIAVQQKVPESLLVSYQEWLHREPRKDGLTTFSKWLQKQVVYRMDVEEVKERTKKKKEESFESKKSKKGAAHTTTTKPSHKCVLCHGPHQITSCKKWGETSVKDRWEVSKENGLCFRCLSSGHQGKNCPENNRCGINDCKGTHHFHLHFEQRPNPPERVDAAVGTRSAFGESEGDVVLRTVPVLLVGPEGQAIKVNAFLDDGSDSTYVRDDIITALGLVANERNLKLSTLTDSCVPLKSKKVTLTIKSLDGETQSTVEAWTLQEMCQGLSIPDWNQHKIKWDHLKNIAFPKIPGKRTIDILIGSDHPELSLALSECYGPIGAPVARKTPLGWTCVGRLPALPSAKRNAFARTFRTQTLSETRLDEQLREMWEIDSLGVRSSDVNQLSQEEVSAMTKAEKSRRWIGGRYEVAIPWKEELPAVPDNREEAEKRLYSLEKSLLKKPEVAQRYKEAMNANVDKGYVRKLETEVVNDGPSWYLPHFPVIREDRETTKVRIVFDSAAKCQGMSLNDAMLTGPKLQRDVLEILLRFRQKPVALVADIKEMFSQIVLAEKDRRYHRLLWRDLDVSKPVDVYEAVRLVFGDRASPYLAQFVVRSHAQDFVDKYPTAAQVMIQDMYMDDILDSEDSETDAILVREDLTKLLSDAGFHAQKWCSNRMKVLEGIPENDRATGVKFDESELPSVKTLGVKWNASEDVFTFTVKEINLSVYTKRGLLSRIATLFDPLQFLAPYTIRAKMALQESWLRGLDWDEEFPDDLKASTQQWVEQLPEAPKVKIPRCYRHDEEVERVSLHTFVDASRLSYAAVSYARYTYIRGHSRRLKSFVANRVAEIQRKSRPTQWRHVPSEENPADDATRGLDLTDLSAESRWFQGPAFLHEGEESWPSESRPGQTDCTEEGKQELLKINLTFQSKKSLPLLDAEKFSSWLRLLRITAYVLRFISKCKTAGLQKEQRNMSSDNQAKNIGPNANLKETLEPEEIKNAEKYWVREAQRERFSEELTNLKGGGTVSKSSQLWRLSPFMDSDGILRVGGRLELSSLPYDAKHPVILPKKHHVSKLVVAHIHNQGHHNLGVNFTLAELRQKFWIVNGREEIKRWERECNFCKLQRKRRGEQIMAPLPDVRLGTSLRCFAHCGVDFAGPFVVKLTRKVSAKRYLCLFTCASSRAVHLEVAFSLDTASFLNAFSRMVRRRGKPEIMISDNGTNFTSAEKELRELVSNLDQTKIKEQTSNDGIRWRFNPPGGSHHGGVFEALIKSAKRALRAILGETKVTDEELLTAVVEVAGILNSRPLTYCSSDPNDEHVLTPNDFLYGQAGGQLAPRVIDEIAFNPRNRWRFVQDLINKCWRRWMKEYLSTLNTRSKWVDQKRNVAPGDVVLLVDTSNPKGQWPLGRIQEVFPGPDGQVRVVRVRTAGKDYVRPITKFCPLKL
ncbi:hypothetical protein ACROYT_G020955 [Oculina patagonica]